MLMQAPPTVVANQQVKLLSGATYTVDANLFVNAASYQDYVNLLNMGFSPTWGGRINYTATVDPANANDSTQDYAVGSLWRNSNVNPSRWWICDAATIGGAVWIPISLGVTQSNAGSAVLTNLTLNGLLQASFTTVTPFSGGGQGSATAMSDMVTNITSSVASTAPYDSVYFTATTNGDEQAVYNNSGNSIQLFGSGSITVNGFAHATGVTIPAGGFYSGKLVNGNWQSMIPGMGFTTNVANTSNSATSGTTLTGANVSGAINEVILSLTGSTSGNANAQMPTVANLLAAIPNPVAGSYKLRVINNNSGNQWTITTDTGWTLTGTMTIANNTWRDFNLTITSVGSATATLTDCGGATIV